ncbi:glutathione S-transferase 1-like [Watersipora subatra]|uniref:glutathione S-transferase 1-like n=1 Tax=Watersipora subatra TaxID=2589382 RepID=UPI00355C5533
MPRTKRKAASSSKRQPSAKQRKEGKSDTKAEIPDASVKAAVKDKLLYFDVYARAEPTRMLYGIAGKEYEDQRIKQMEWPAIKAEQPLGQMPVFECQHGTLVMSNTIARYVARELGLAGSSSWEEALNDMVVETCFSCADGISEKIYAWKMFRQPQPDNSEKLIEEIREKITKSLKFIEALADKRGKKFIVSDKINLADVWLYNMLQFGRPAFPDLMSLTPWVKRFVERMEADDKMKKYLASRPASEFGI